MPDVSARAYGYVIRVNLPDDDLTAATGARIDLFKEGASGPLSLSATMAQEGGVWSVSAIVPEGALRLGTYAVQAVVDLGEARRSVSAEGLELKVGW